MGNTSIFEMMEQYFPIKELVGNDDILEEGRKSKEAEM